MAGIIIATYNHVYRGVNWRCPSAVWLMCGPWLAVCYVTYASTWPSMAFMAFLNSMWQPAYCGGGPRDGVDVCGIQR